MVEENVSRKLFITKSAFNNRNLCWEEEIKIDQNVFQLLFVFSHALRNIFY